MGEAPMSLRKVSGARVESSGFWVFKTHRFFYTQRGCFSLGASAYRTLLGAIQAHGVGPVGADGDRVLWWTGDGCFWADDSLDAEAVGLLIWDRARRQEVRLDRLRTIRAREQDASGARRERIPEDVRAFVWTRDEGRCVRCEADQELQFDHVIPVAKGGGNAADNIQVLCGDCNRLKSDSIV